jgi:hypothetical protein
VSGVLREGLTTASAILPDASTSWLRIPRSDTIGILGGVGSMRTLSGTLENAVSPVVVCTVFENGAEKF